MMWGIVDMLPRWWVRACMYPCMQWLRCRRLANMWWLLVIIQLALMAFVILRYDLINIDIWETPSSVSRCRREFINSYEDFCRNFLRPHPSNIINRHVTSSSSSERHDLPLCPCVPFSVAETVHVNHAINMTWDDVVRAQLSSGTLVSDHKYQQPQPRTGKAESYQLMAGGRSMPMLCIPRHRVAVIIPFRARDQHLTSFINHLYPFLRSQLLDFIIVVVEQENPEIFNRGALMNIGFVEVMKLAAEVEHSSIDCVILHDVDLLPEDRYNFYVCSPLPRHMAAYRSKWNYRLWLYQKFFGGVTSFRPDHYKVINGFSNKFYGWGGEDDDLFHRVMAKKIALSDRYPKCVSKYSEKTHERDSGNPIGVDKDLGTLYRPEEYDSDGLNTLNYTVISRRDMTLYTRIVVNLPDKPSVAAARHASWRVTATLTLLICFLSIPSSL